MTFLPQRFAPMFLLAASFLMFAGCASRDMAEITPSSRLSTEKQAVVLRDPPPTPEQVATAARAKLSSPREVGETTTLATAHSKGGTRLKTSSLQTASLSMEPAHSTRDRARNDTSALAPSSLAPAATIDAAPNFEE